MPEISVIVPVYKVEKYLKEALDSLYFQTFQDFEAILVDDGSPDSCPQIIDEYTKKDKRFFAVHQSNQGLSMARNNGLKKATGKYIYFFDSDDVMHPQLLEIAHDFAKRYDADLVSFEFQKLKTPTPQITLIDSSKIKHILCNQPLYLGTKKKGKRISFNAWSKLYKREVIKDLSFITGIHFEDYPFTFAVLAKHPKTVVLNTELYFYRINPNSISNQNVNAKQVEDYQTGIDSIYEIYKASHLKKELDFLKRTFIPIILKEQLKKCNEATGQNKENMLLRFAQELKDLDQKELIGLRGYRLKEYFIYRQLITKGKL